MNRFFVDPNFISGETVKIVNQDQLRQITRVLRLKIADTFVVFDNTSFEYEVLIEKLSDKILEGKILNKKIGNRESQIDFTLAQAFMKGDKMELVLQKGVELGIKKFILFPSRNCTVRELSDNKVRRYLEIIKEATEQCGGCILSELKICGSFSEMLEEVKNTGAEVNLIAWEKENRNFLKSFLNKKSYSVAVGPEGGFDPEEIFLAEKEGVVPVSLGRRILRAETAGIAVAARVLMG